MLKVDRKTRKVTPKTLKIWPAAFNPFPTTFEYTRTATVGVRPSTQGSLTRPLVAEPAISQTRRHVRFVASDRGASRASSLSRPAMPPLSSQSRVPGGGQPDPTALLAHRRTGLGPPRWSERTAR